MLKTLNSPTDPELSFPSIFGKHNLMILTSYLKLFVVVVVVVLWTFPFMVSIWVQRGRQNLGNIFAQALTECSNLALEPSN